MLELLNFVGLRSDKTDSWLLMLQSCVFKSTEREWGQRKVSSSQFTVPGASPSLILSQKKKQQTGTALH